MEWIPTQCGCRLTLDGETGEPISFITRCEVHQTAEPGDIAAENRAMSLCQIALAEYFDVDPGEVMPQIVGDDRHARAQVGNMVVEFQKVTLAQYLEQHAEAVKRVRRV